MITNNPISFSIAHEMIACEALKVTIFIINATLSEVVNIHYPEDRFHLKPDYKYLQSLNLKHCPPRQFSSLFHALYIFSLENEGHCQVELFPKITKRSIKIEELNKLN